MGLDITHGAWHGSYGAFNRFRKAIADSAGGSYPPHSEAFTKRMSFAPDPNRWYVQDEFTRDLWPGLYELLNHSDFDGEISPEMCRHVANDLTKLRPRFESMGVGWGAAGGYLACLDRFIEGCNAAARAAEPLEFL